MNGVHDMGGMHGMGPIDHEAQEPVFHHEWERRAFALTMATGLLGKWNIDMGRFAREQMPPGEYLETTYYEHWLFGLLRLLDEKGLVPPAELETCRRGETVAGPQPAPPGLRVLRPPDVHRALRNRRAARCDDPVAPKFKAGDAVIAKNTNPLGHTRLPRYVRGRRGVVDRDHGVFTFPDTHAAGQGKKPQHVYSVRFAARELWGPEASARDAIYVDLWDDYLDADPER
ncbi:MAG: nitrile hydratase subunit beta [Candidatus Rokuibacteriota bacterium]